jgi:hypothetical protein
MVRILLFTLMSLACSGLLAATVYRWVDENGVVHYSDQPHANAEKVQVSAPQTYKSGQYSNAASGAPPQDPGASAPAPAYQGCSIAQPFDGQDFSNIPSLAIAVRTDPGLHPGDQVFIMMDGGLINGGAATGTQFVLTPVDRGTHTMQALIRDGNGTLQCQSPPVTFNVHQVSAANPANPVRPH